MTNHEPLCTGVKVCKSCNRELPVLFFSANKRCKDGLNPNCRDCNNRRVNQMSNVDKRLVKLEKIRNLYNLPLKRGQV